VKNSLLRLRRKIRQFCPLSGFAGNLFIVGAQKSGTSALHSYLEKHPQLASGDIKEIHFFDREQNFAQGASFYRLFFPIISKNRMSIDSTPKYLYYSHCAERIHDYSPQAKIVILLREPVARAFSAFNMYKQIFGEKWFKNLIKETNQDWKAFSMPLLNQEEIFSIEYFLEKEIEIIKTGGANEEPSLIRRGLYAPQIERYLRLFGKDNVLIIFSNELKKEPDSVVQKVLSFSGLKPMSNSAYPLKHVRDYTTDIKDKELIHHYADEWFEKDRETLINTYNLKVPW
jgi:hypothetical protein